MKPYELVRFVLDLLVLVAAVLAFALILVGGNSVAHGSSFPHKAKLSTRYICPQGNHGVPLVPTHRNIMRGICVVADG